MSKSSLSIHIFHLNEEGPSVENLEEENEDIVAANHWVLPAGTHLIILKDPEQLQWKKNMERLEVFVGLFFKGSMHIDYIILSFVDGNILWNFLVVLIESLRWSYEVLFFPVIVVKVIDPVE